jgi:hypothetical protein
MKKTVIRWGWDKSWRHPWQCPIGLSSTGIGRSSNVYSQLPAHSGSAVDQSISQRKPESDPVTFNLLIRQTASRSCVSLPTATHGGGRGIHSIGELCSRSVVDAAQHLISAAFGQHKSSQPKLTLFNWFDEMTATCPRKMTNRMQPISNEQL